MHVRDSIEHLRHDLAGIHFIKAVAAPKNARYLVILVWLDFLLDKIGATQISHEILALNKLHHKVQLRRRIYHIVQVGNVQVLKLFQYLHFFLH